MLHPCKVRSFWHTFRPRCARVSPHVIVVRRDAPHRIRRTEFQRRCSIKGCWTLKVELWSSASTGFASLLDSNAVVFFFGSSFFRNSCQSVWIKSFFLCWFCYEYSRIVVLLLTLLLYLFIVFAAATVVVAAVVAVLLWFHGVVMVLVAVLWVVFPRWFLSVELQRPHGVPWLHPSGPLRRKRRSTTKGHGKPLTWGMWILGQSWTWKETPKSRWQYTYTTNYNIYNMSFLEPSGTGPSIVFTLSVLWNSLQISLFRTLLFAEAKKLAWSFTWELHVVYNKAMVRYAKYLSEKMHRHLSITNLCWKPESPKKIHDHTRGEETEKCHEINTSFFEGKSAIPTMLAHMDQNFRVGVESHNQGMVPKSRFSSYISTMKSYPIPGIFQGNDDSWRIP